MALFLFTWQRFLSCTGGRRRRKEGGEIKKECDEGIVGRTVVVYESNLSSATAAFFLYVKAL